MTQHQKCDKVRACVHAQMLCILRVFMFMSLYLLLMWFVPCLSSVLVSLFMLYLYSFRSQFSVVGGILFTSCIFQETITTFHCFAPPTVLRGRIAPELELFLLGLFEELSRLSRSFQIDEEWICRSVVTPTQVFARTTEFHRMKGVKFNLVVLRRREVLQNFLRFI